MAVMDVINYLCWDESLTMLVKGSMVLNEMALHDMVDNKAVTDRTMIS